MGECRSLRQALYHTSVMELFQTRWEEALVGALCSQLLAGIYLLPPETRHIAALSAG